MAQAGSVEDPWAMVTSLSAMCRRRARRAFGSIALPASTGRSSVAGAFPEARATVLTECPRAARASPR